MGVGSLCGQRSPTVLSSMRNHAPLVLSCLIEDRLNFDPYPTLMNSSLVMSFHIVVRVPSMLLFSTEDMLLTVDTGILVQWIGVRLNPIIQVLMIYYCVDQGGRLSHP